MEDARSTVAGIAVDGVGGSTVPVDMGRPVPVARNRPSGLGMPRDGWNLVVPEVGAVCQAWPECGSTV